MGRTTKKPGARRPSGREIIAAIDVGSISIRMCIAEVGARGRHKPLEAFTVPVRLGADTFSSGAISPASIQAACEGINGFNQALKAYKVQRVRAVATSAVREAANADTFVDRVQSVTGIRLEVIEGIEETRLTYAVLKSSLQSSPHFTASDSILLDLGAGSAEITIFQKGRIVLSETRRVGTLRLREMVSSLPQAKLADLVGPILRNVVQTVRCVVPLDGLKNFYLISSDAYHLLSPRGNPHGSEVLTIDRERFESVVREVLLLSPRDLLDRFDLQLSESDTVAPALLAINTFLQATPARQVTMLRVNMLDSLLASMAAGSRISGAAEQEFQQQIASCAVGIGRKYRFDEPHALRVAGYATALFDQLRRLHGLGAEERMLLGAAGIFHDIGSYVSTRQHHKHTMYLVNASECFGLTREQMSLVGIVCRYHRRAVPRTQHVEYTSLSRGNRMRVSKLAALLRIAEGLDHTHSGAIRQVRSAIDGDQLVLSVDSDEDISLGRLALRNKANLFEQLYGLEVVMRRISGG